MATAKPKATVTRKREWRIHASRCRKGTGTGASCGRAECAFDTEGPDHSRTQFPVAATKIANTIPAEGTAGVLMDGLR